MKSNHRTHVNFVKYKLSISHQILHMVLLNNHHRLLIIAFAVLWSWAAVALANDSIPFLYRGHLHLPACINDEYQANVIFDTGGSDLFGVDSVYFSASAWHPQKIGWAKTGGGAGSTTVRVVMDPTALSIGTIKSTYHIVPIFKLRDVVDCHVDGIWGIKDIEQHPLEINFEHSFLKYYTDGNPRVEGYKKLPIRCQDHRILVQAEVLVGGKSIQGWFLVDTGSGASLDFTSSSVKQFGLESLPGKRYIHDMTQFGIGDKAQESIIDMQSQRIVIGSDTTVNEVISYLPDGTGAFGEKEYIGIIGNGMLSKFNLVIDIAHGALYLKRFKEDRPAKPTYDFDFRNRTDIGQGWIVSSLTRDGDATHAGLQLNDRIIAVNGRPVEDYTWEEEYRIDELPEITLDIISTNGEPRQITLSHALRW